MNSCDILIVGGQGAGLSAVSEIRKFDNSSKILILEKSEYISFSNCGIPLYLMDKANLDDLIYYPKESFEKKRNVKILTGVKVLEINNYKREALFKVLSDNREEKVKFSKLLLAVGGIPSFPFEKNFKRVFTIRGAESAIKLKNFILNESPSNVLIVGGGMVGLEMAEALNDLGIKPMIFERDEILKKVALEGRNLLYEEFRKRGITLKEGADVNNFREIEDGIVIDFEGKEKIFDFLIFSTGIVPGTRFIKFEPELKTISNGAIEVNEFMETSLKNIYGAGDCIAFRDHFGRVTYSPSGQLANIMGRIAGRNMAGKYTPFSGSLNVVKIKLFQFEMGWCGICEEKGNVKKFSLITFSHPKYVYSETNRQFVDIYYDFYEGKVVGASLFGHHNIFSSLDLISMLIFKGGKLGEFFTMETGYTPKGDNSLNILHQIFLKMENFF